MGNGFKPGSWLVGIALVATHGGALAQLGPSVAQAELTPITTPLLQAVTGWLNAMLLMMSITVALLASLHRRERKTLYLSGMMLGWLAMRGASMTPLAADGALRALVMTLFVLASVQFLLRQVGSSRRRLFSWLLMQCLLVPGSFVLTTLLVPGLSRACAALWASVMTLEVVAAIGWHLHKRSRRLVAPDPPEREQSFDFLRMLVLLAPMALALFMDQALLLLAPGVWAVFSPWLGVLVPLLLVGLGLQMLVVFARSRHAAEAQVAQIETRVNERLSEAERNFAQVAEQRLEQVTERERKRIAADLHDDLGAKLLTIVHTSESDRISTLAREALEEMRLSVRGLTGKPVQLLDALGDWRAEVISRLGQANIRAEWVAPAEDTVHTLPARFYVQTTRIFRETVSNIIKHSGASQCVITCAVVERDFVVKIKDNGNGIPPGLDARVDRGHGLASMKARAKQMHGQCLVESGAGRGTVIRLTVPL